MSRRCGSGGRSLIDLAAIKLAFPEVENLSPLVQSGQKDVLRGAFKGQACVLKLLKPTPEAREQMQREIEAAAQLQCDYVPTLFESGERAINGDARFYVVEQYISGETLRARFDRDKVLPLADVILLARVLLQACVDFEGRGFVHRDIKPENILLDSHGKIWVIDFGIVRFLGLQSLTPTLAQWGRFTLGYGSPEQMRNMKPEIDARTDLFAVGVVLYEALYGQNPYYEGKQNQIDVLQHMMNRDLAPLEIDGDVDDALSTFLRALTARFPSRRPQTAKDALAWFEEFAARLTPPEVA